jgi:virginiamycin B lyase
MRVRDLACGVAAVALAASAHAATISGTVTGAGNAPVAGVFVQAENNAANRLVSVLSDSAGHFRLPNLTAGQWVVSAHGTGSVGLSSTPQTETVTADQNLTLDVKTASAPLKWTEISMAQGRALLPDAKGKTIMFQNCFACHGFETRMAGRGPHSEQEWQTLVDYMMNSMHFFLGTVGHVGPDEEKELVAYLTDNFGPNSKLPAPDTLPKYQDVKQSFGPEAQNIVYVEYDMPGPNRMSWSAFPAKDGHYWIPYYGDANMIARLDPASGHVDEYQAPNQGTAAIHSAVPAPDGSVWFTEQGANKLGRWDPDTKKITEFQDASIPGKENTLGGGSKHTLRIAADGDVWATGGPLARFEPKTGKFTEIPEIPSAYGIALDQKGTVWFAEFTPAGQIGQIDPKTLHVTKYQLPTARAFPRRIQVDTDGTIWVAEYTAGKLAHFDPKTEHFAEYDLPGPEATPYALGIGRDHTIWYSSEYMDYIGRLDPATGKVTKYPVPQSENTMREFYPDDQGRMWFGTPANNKVGYFYLAP